MPRLQNDVIKHQTLHVHSGSVRFGSVRFGPAGGPAKQQGVAIRLLNEACPLPEPPETPSCFPRLLHNVGVAFTFWSHEALTFRIGPDFEGARNFVYRLGPQRLDELLSSKVVSHPNARRRLLSRISPVRLTKLPTPLMHHFFVKNCTLCEFFTENSALEGRKVHIHDRSRSRSPGS